MLSNRNKKVPLNKKGNTSVVDYGNWLTVILHTTAVVQIDRDKNIMHLNSGGWHTPTTKQRINQASEEYNLGIVVYQKKWEWYVDLADGNTVDFTDGMTIDLTTGKLHGRRVRGVLVTEEN